MGQPSLWEQIQHQVFLGGDGFIEAMRGKIAIGTGLDEIPPAKMQEISEDFGLHCSCVSSIVQADREAKIKADAKGKT